MYVLMFNSTKSILLSMVAQSKLLFLLCNLFIIGYLIVGLAKWKLSVKVLLGTKLNTNNNRNL